MPSSLNRSYLLGGDDQSLFKESLLHEEQLLDNGRDPDLVTRDAGELDELQDVGVEQGVAHGQGQVDVSYVTRAVVDCQEAGGADVVAAVGVGPHAEVVEAIWKRGDVSSGDVSTIGQLDICSRCTCH